MKEVKGAHALFILVIANIALMCLYFSSVPLFQNIISPASELLGYRHSREYGLLETMQNLLLTSIITLLLCEFKARHLLIEKFIFITGALLFAFLLLEEIDYGIHYYRLLISDFSDASNFNWHNADSFSESGNTDIFKKVMDGCNGLWFLIIPALVLLLGKKAPDFVPSLWFVTAFICSLLFSKMGHYFNDLGLGIINGIQGSLHGNISEFREFNVYYIYLIYTLQLKKSKDLRLMLMLKHKP